MPKKRIVIDVATIYPGKGGAGGGIWSYAKNLLLHLDEEPEQGELELICLANKEFPLSLRNIDTVVLPWNFQNFLIRFFYVHVFLPLYVLRKKAVLHKVYFEAPYFSPAGMLVTIHDCMSDFYRKKNYLAASSPAEKLKLWYFSQINRRAIRQSRCICTPSQAIKDEIVGYYHVPAEKIVVTPLASGLVPTPPAEAKQQANSAFRLYCIAAFHQHKGHLRLIRIFEHMIASYDINAQLFFRGHVHDAGYYNNVKETINASPAKDKIHLLSYEAKSSVGEIYASADWVILLSEYEGFGLPVIEAQAHAKPVICSNIPTFREVAGDSVFYLANEDDDAFAAAQLFRLLMDGDMKKNLVNKGLANAKKYDWSKFAVQMKNLYEQLAETEMPEQDVMALHKDGLHSGATQK